MKYIAKFAVLFFIFTLLFVVTRGIGFFDSRILYADIDGVGWLYSAFASIFGIMGAFTIQAQSNQWDNLTKAIKDEVSGLRRILWLSTHGDSEHQKQIRAAISRYLENMSKSEWKKIDQGVRSRELEEDVKNLQEAVYQLGKHAPHLIQSATSLLDHVIESREERIFHSAKRTPFLLKGILYFGATMMIFLSNLIGIRNMVLDYLFTGTVALLITLIVAAIDDLEHPYRPGAWHVTQKEYKTLLAEIK